MTVDSQTPFLENTNPLLARTTPGEHDQPLSGTYVNASQQCLTQCLEDPGCLKNDKQVEASADYWLP